MQQLQRADPELGNERLALGQRGTCAWLPARLPGGRVRANARGRDVTTAAWRWMGLPHLELPQVPRRAPLAPQASPAPQAPLAPQAAARPVRQGRDSARQLYPAC